MILLLAALLISAPPKDPSKEYQENYYFYHRFYVDDVGEEDDTVKAILKEGRPYEGDIGVIIDELTRAGSIAIDCGSHIGVHTITMSKKVGPEGRVMAFEPNRKLHSELLYNLELNDCHNVTPIPKAVGADFKTAYLKWGKIDLEPSSRGYFVDVVPIDSYHLENISLIKLDVENYEYAALTGAKETILKNKPILIFECWLDVNQRENFLKVISLIQEMGYEIRVIHSCNFIAFPLDVGFPLSLYREKFAKLDLENFDPERFVPLGDGLQYFRSWGSP